MRRNIVINSALLFSIAATIETILHESGHFIAAWMYHATDLSLHHNYVRYEDGSLSIHQRILIAAAGPFVSLFTGILFHRIIKQYRRPNLLRLFLVYMSAFGYIGFLGYLMIAPFFTYGDTGFICNALQFPAYVTAALAILAVLLLFFVMQSICSEFVPFLTKEEYEDDAQRKPYFNALIHFPLYIGITITTLLNLPVPTFLSLIAPICSPFSIMWGFAPLMWKKYDYPTVSNETPSIDQLSVYWFIVFILTVVVNRLLVHGAHV